MSFAPRWKQKITHDSTFHNRPENISSFGIFEDFFLVEREEEEEEEEGGGGGGGGGGGDYYYYLVVIIVLHTHLQFII